MKLAIIGAALFQEPLIEKAKKMGIETHVFAWKSGTPGETMADYFYPISIREKDEILEKCRELKIDGIASIASDLAMETVNYVAEELNLPGNSVAATKISTNKHWMREAFAQNGDPSPKSMLFDSTTDLDDIKMEYPLIVKPTDRSGSRGVHKVVRPDRLRAAIEEAREYSFEDKAVIEEFVEGDEYSIEYISFNGEHYFLAATQKITTGAPRFVETGHREPAELSETVLEKIKKISSHALDTLELKNGAAHIEIKINGDDIKIIEIGGRMGGDFIGSDLVEMSTGYDYVSAVIRIAMGMQPEIPDITEYAPVGVNFILTAADVEEYEKYKEDESIEIVKESIDEDLSDMVTDSSNRHGYYIFRINK